MPTNPMSEVIQHLRSILLPEGADLTDGQLLESFVSRRETTALEALVRRHGSMVWGVCHRILQNHHDAEDAFQATFLVLVRKAASIFPRTKVGNWLYGVAHQTALKARATRAKRRGREKAVTEMPELAVEERDTWSDLQAVLDQELSRLPEKYRTVIVLCELEGKTVKGAARQLGCPLGTVGSRLARAREMLAKRLTQRGVALSGGALAAVMTEKVASAGVPLSVVASTIKAITLVSAGQAVGLISVKVAALTEGVLKSMLLTKLKTTTGVLLLVAALVGGTELIYQTQAAEQAKAEQGNKKPPKIEAKAAAKEPDADGVIRFPDTPPPFQAFAVVYDKTLILTAQRPFYFGDTSARLVEPIRQISEMMCNLEYVQAFDTKGKRIEATKLRDLLTKNTDVLVSADGRPVDPYYLRLIKEGTVVLILEQAAKKPGKKEDKNDKPAESKAEAKIKKMYKVFDLLDEEDTTAQPLIRLITMTLLPRSWSENGGDGLIEYLPEKGSLFIRHTPEIHEQVQDLLDALRRRSQRLMPPEMKP